LAAQICLISLTAFSNEAITVFGRTKGEAQANLTELYYQNPAKALEEHNPIF